MKMYVRFVPLHLLNISNGSMEYVELLNVTKAVTELSFTQVPRIIKAIRHNGWIAGDCKPGATISITDAGMNELLMHQEMIEYSAQQHKEQTFQNKLQNKLAILSLLIALPSSLVGALLEHFFQGINAVFGWFASLL